jgi:hypothetical protein
LFLGFGKTIVKKTGVLSPFREKEGLTTGKLTPPSTVLSVVCFPAYLYLAVRGSWFLKWAMRMRFIRPFSSSL